MLGEQRRDSAPLDWAYTQKSLGDALSASGNASRHGAADEAAEAYRSALEAYARDRAPLDWAETTTSLGNVLQMLGEGEGRTASLEGRPPPTATRSRNSGGPRAARVGPDAGQSWRCAAEARRGRQRNGAARAGGRRLSCSARGIYPPARATRLGGDPEQSRIRAEGARRA